MSAPDPAETPAVASPSDAFPHTRVFYRDGSFASYPVEAYEALRDAVRRGDPDIETTDAFGSACLVVLDAVYKVQRRDAASMARRHAVYGS